MKHTWSKIYRIASWKTFHYISKHGVLLQFVVLLFLIIWCILFPDKKQHILLFTSFFCEGAKAQTEWQVYYQLMLFLQKKKKKVYYQLIVHFIPWQNNCHILLFIFLLFNLVLVKLNGSHLLVKWWLFFIVTFKKKILK